MRTNNAKKIAIQNAQAEQPRAVEALRHCLVEKEGKLEELTKMLNAIKRKENGKKDFHIISVSLWWQDILASFTELFNLRA